ncbi:phospholipid transfer hypothetical protein [Limosa lapponica baueri]|uniref:Lipid-binding serum glycoprotein N-terminal domain-containing protein n=1 Tax=Limosa lapponica baueri TaxID=1758121 RepID=A0A2I0T4J2_LIMLA|nr:phospholipid transfer hypothetical protein [Limosa lapponica baueri]
MSDLHGKEGQFHYNITQVKVMDLQLASSDLHFQPQQHLVFNISNASISLRFRRQLLYWFFYDIGSINASADGVHIHTVLQLAKDEAGRLKISNMTCNASIARMHAGFSGTLRKVYEFLSTFIVTGMRFLLSQQGFLTVGADLHFSKGLREVIEKYRPVPTTPTYPSSWPAEPTMDPHQL